MFSGPMKLMGEESGLSGDGLVVLSHAADVDTQPELHTRVAFMHDGFLWGG